MDKQAERFGQPVSALLGSIEAQIQLGLPSIGGKDSMSGTFEELTVPPTLVAFGVTTADSRKGRGILHQGLSHQGFHPDY